MPEPPAEAVVFDTDVASRSFRERLPPPLAARLVGKQPILTFVTVGELAQWTKLRHWGPRNLAMLDGWLADKPVIPGSKAIAALWGGLSAAAIQRGRPRPVNDTWVAACCLAYQLPLATLNLKDFKDFAEHHGLRLLEPLACDTLAHRGQRVRGRRGTAAAPTRLPGRGSACRGRSLHPWSPTHLAPPCDRPACCLRGTW